MRTYVITGGTDGMGRGLGLFLLARGDRVVAVASGAEKGAAFLRAAGELGAAGRAEFVRGDLSIRAGMTAALAGIGAATEVVDGLVFGAQRFRPRRQETGDGIEFTFALHYLSRYVLGHGLVPALERAARPVVLNLAGPGGMPGRIHWEDPNLRERYSGMRAAMQASRANDLLGVDFARRHPTARTRYVLYNPMFVRTAMADPLPAPLRLLTRAVGLIAGQSVDEAVPPLARLLDDPPAEPVSAFRRHTRLPLTGKDFDPGAARRLDDLTRSLLD